MPGPCCSAVRRQWSQGECFGHASAAVSHIFRDFLIEKQRLQFLAHFELRALFVSRSNGRDTCVVMAHGDRCSSWKHGREGGAVGSYKHHGMILRTYGWNHLGEGVIGRNNVFG